MKAEIIAVGTELLLGDILNTNAQYLSKELATLGIEVYHQCVVGDNPARMRETIETGFSRSDILITTGGLGPTADDLTKEIAAEYFGEELVKDEKALKQISDFFNRIKKEMTDNNIKQAYVPKENGTVLYNANGTAPGIIFSKNDKIMILLPGPPHEVLPMFENQVKPFLAKIQEVTYISEILRVVNLGESKMEHMVKDLIEAQTNPTIAPYAKDSEAILRITAKAKSEDEARKLIAPCKKALRERLGESIYAEGETTMEDVLIGLLKEKNQTVAVAESCTGGLAMSTLIGCSGASAVVLEGCVTYSNEAKMNRLGVKKETLDKFGAVSKEVATEMAEGIAKTAGANMGIATTGVAGPDGGTAEKPVGLVYIAVCYNGKTVAKEFRFDGDRNKIRQRASFHSLNFARKIFIESN
ncbi:MAG: competence/damage-inducible protein A [Bacillota bacterium]